MILLWTNFPMQPFFLNHKLSTLEAKEQVDGAPKPVKEGVDKATAADLEAKLKETGAEVEVA
jgi:large subunit ribosomal protein L7/L12